MSQSSQKIKCIGCGAVIQTEKKELEGFIPASALEKADQDADIYCQRCFRLRHYNDLMDIVDIYREISDYKLIFTKLDETSSYGNLLNIRLYADADLSYVTNGQNVPDDIEVFDTQKIVKQLLGGR